MEGDTLYVIKRDGRKEEANIANIRKQTIPACEGLDKCSYEALELGAQILFQDGIKTSDIQKTLIKTAARFIDIDAPNWTYVAGRLQLYEIYHNIKRLYGVPGNGNVYDKVTLQMYIDYNKDKLSTWYEKYSSKDIEELNKCIDSKKDLLYTRPAMLTLEERYLIKDIQNRVTELPQHMHMAVAMFAAQNEDDPVAWAKDFYDALSNLKMIAGTPINSNGRLKNGCTASCLVGNFDDNIESIFDNYKEIALGSKYGYRVA